EQVGGLVPERRRVDLGRMDRTFQRQDKRNSLQHTYRPLHTRGNASVAMCCAVRSAETLPAQAFRRETLINTAWNAALPPPRIASRAGMRPCGEAGNGP